MRQAIDQNALNCVRRELGKLLQKARELLEDYDANPDDPELLYEAAGHLHELHGPLQMLEVRAADLLAREMERVIDDLLKNLVAQPAVALELIMQALLQLPDYLSGLQSGKQENPALLMPLVNGLRSVRSAQPLNESAVFSPDISVPMPVSEFSAQPAADREDPRQVAREERRRFQAGLLEWFRSGTESTGLQSLSGVLERLQAAAAREPLARLWWISAGIVEALSAGLLVDAPEIKRLFGHIDRQIKYLADRGEAAVADQLPAELFSELLYQLACAGTREGRIDMIRSTYRLDECLSPAADHDVLADYPGSYHEGLIQAVAINLREDIDRIRDQMQDIHKPAQDAPGALESVLTDLHMLGNSLDMIGMEKLGASLAGQERLLSAAIGTNSAVSETTITDITGTLGVIEELLTATDSEPVYSGMPDSSACLQEQGEDIRDIVELMMLAKSALDDCAGSPDNAFLLDPVPGFLSQTQSGLQIIGQSRAAAVLSQVEEFITHELMASRGRSMTSQLDKLADAISCIDCYIGELGDNRDPGEVMLEIAESSMAGLARHVPDELDSGAGNVPAERTIDDADVRSGEADYDNRSSRAITPHDSTDCVGARTDLPGYGVAQTGVPPEDGPVMPAQSDDEFPVLSADADPEIVEIYLEEAAGELETLSGVLPAWLADPGDGESLEVMRRSFHTLKGSGRMAGAMRAGEFSWSVENLLNKILDGSVEPDRHVCDLLGQVLEPLAQLMEQISGHSDPGIDIQPLMARAEVLASGNRTEAGSESSGVEADYEPGPEPELMAIFTSECREHLQTLKAFLATATAGCAVTEPVARALHTITGISETVGATSVNVLMTELYSYFDGLYELQWPVDTAALGVLSESVQAIDSQLEYGPAGEIDAGWLSGLLADIRSLPEITGERPVISRDVEDTRVHPAPDIVEVMQVGVDACATSESDGKPDEGHGDGRDPYANMDPELVEIFIEEAAEIIDSCENIQRNWASDPGDSDYLGEFQRQLHTLKGSARMVNIDAIGDLSHALESVLTEVADARIGTSENLFSLLVEVQDGLAGMLDQIRNRQIPAAAENLLAALECFQRGDAPAVEAATTAVKTDPLPEPVPAETAAYGAGPEIDSGQRAEIGIDPGPSAGKVPAGASSRVADDAAMHEKRVQVNDAVRPEDGRRKTSRIRGEQIRVPASLLDDMVNLAGEITIYRSRIEQQVSDYRFSLTNLSKQSGVCMNSCALWKSRRKPRSCFVLNRRSISVTGNSIFWKWIVTPVCRNCPAPWSRVSAISGVSVNSWMDPCVSPKFCFCSSLVSTPDCRMD